MDHEHEKPREAVKLTIKQEAFARAYVETGNAAEAYRRSYDVSPDCSAQVCAQKGYELLTHGEISVRVDQLREQHAKRHDITIDSLTEMLIEDRILARTEKEAKSAIDAVMAIAKLHGKITDKVEQKTTGSMTLTTVDRPERETREDWIARRERELACAAAPVGTAARTPS